MTSSLSTGWATGEKGRRQAWCGEWRGGAVVLCFSLIAVLLRGN